MAKYRIDIIADLARQLSFTPSETRLAQVASAEELLHTLDPTKAYPVEYVVFRITGYHPKTLAPELLTGLALQHDLGVLVEHVSETLETHANELAEPVLMIDDVCERFNVTSKTIQRWRRRGLPGRRFVFADGKRRVGFLLSSVERFVSRNREQVERGANFSQVEDAERDEIIRRARRLATMCQCCVNEISRRIARRLRRSPLTVLHTIRKYDEQHPAEAIFVNAAEPMTEDDRARIVRHHKHGLDLRTIARRVCQPRGRVYRVLVDERIERMARRKVKFIDDSLYHQPDAARVIEALANADSLEASPKGEELRVPKDLPAYLQELYRTPLFTPARERAMFLKMHFERYQFIQARRRLEPEFARAKELNELEGCLRRATETKNQIVRANLRLVVSIARRHLRPNLSLMELVSEGNLTLMRAADSFDIHMGNRFSTYATLALMKGFARTVPMLLASGMPASRSAAMENVADHTQASVFARVHDREELGQLLSRLDDRELTVVLAHFGIDDTRTANRDGRGAMSVAAPATLDEIGLRMGISKAKVRQIERNAMNKLRGEIGV